MTENEKSVITKQILTYLIEHPDAQDTLEGITYWWLLEQQIKTSISTVRVALTDLLSKELIVEQGDDEQRVRYAVNPAKLSEIRMLVASDN